MGSAVCLDGGRQDLSNPYGLPGWDCLQYGRLGRLLDAAAAFGYLVPGPGTIRFCSGSGGCKRLLPAHRG